jgi:hypothetical protein
MSVLLTILGILLYAVSAVVVVINLELHDVWDKGVFVFFLSFLSVLCPVVNTVFAVFAIRTDVFKERAKDFWEDIKGEKNPFKGIKDMYKK